MANIQDEIDKLGRMVKLLQSDDEPLRNAVQATHARQVVRIFEDGINSSGSAIGSYKNNSPVYVDPVTAPKNFPKKGKNGSAKFKNGSSHKTGYFPSWGAHRAAIGREGNRVNLRYSNDLQSDFANSTVSESSNKIASPRPIRKKKGVFVVTLSRPINQKKREGIEKKYGPVFNLTQNEKVFFTETLDKEIQIAIANA